ncbi:hypothetical protein pv_344 [Pithovirus sibericum]|uniref:Uncharacterized protein n=1 Tax=Pithovirus sibericum TaxID=1450746 RepID=W5S5B2_9VIRU|nr:hypothetical protein pv_344 [Pithovirus sibericum]AHH01911.1 hypothetical protein pv_344 [Pithovirus sibericum]
MQKSKINLLDVDHDQIVEMVKNNQVRSEIFQSWNFWAKKSSMDFGIGSVFFFRGKNFNISPRDRYLQLEYLFTDKIKYGVTEPLPDSQTFLGDSINALTRALTTDNYDAFIKIISSYFLSRISNPALCSDLVQKAILYKSKKILHYLKEIDFFQSSHIENAFLSFGKVEKVSDYIWQNPRSLLERIQKVLKVGREDLFLNDNIWKAIWFLRSQISMDEFLPFLSIEKVELEEKQAAIFDFLPDCDRKFEIVFMSNNSTLINLFYDHKAIFLQGQSCRSACLMGALNSGNLPRVQMMLQAAFSFDESHVRAFFAEEGSFSKSYFRLSLLDKMIESALDIDDSILKMSLRKYAFRGEIDILLRILERMATRGLGYVEILSLPACGIKLPKICHDFAERKNFFIFENDVFFAEERIQFRF